MRVAVLGAGVIGVTTAWYLARAGHEVIVIDRRDAPARETSFANGGQVSASHAEPWANPHAIVKIAKWLGREDAPLLFRMRADLRQWQWGMRFLLECTPGRWRRNTAQCLNLALYSQRCLSELRSATHVQYDALQRGILQFYTEAAEFAQGSAAADLLRPFGCDRQVKTAAECVVIEPALAPRETWLAGGIYSASDESGDAHTFTCELARLAAEGGAVFRWRSTLTGLASTADAITDVQIADDKGVVQTLKADAYVMALGSYSALWLRRVGIPSAVYPVKGYSATIDIGSHRGAPAMSLTDEAMKIVITRLGDRLRIAGTAELAGYDTSINEVRGNALLARAFALFPDAGSRDTALLWAGLRPAVPSNVPVVGRTRYRNLFLNTGHGTLGWTMACGSGHALAEIMSGRRPEVDFTFA